MEQLYGQPGNPRGAKAKVLSFASRSSGNSHSGFDTLVGQSGLDGDGRAASRSQALRSRAPNGN